MKIDFSIPGTLEKYGKYLIPHKDQSSFEEERKELNERHCERDENGIPVIEYRRTGARYKIVDIQSFQIEYKELKDKYKDLMTYNSLSFEDRVIYEMRKDKLKRILKIDE